MNSFWRRGGELDAPLVPRRPSSSLRQKVCLRSFSRLNRSAFIKPVSCAAPSGSTGSDRPTPETPQKYSGTTRCPPDAVDSDINSEETARNDLRPPDSPAPPDSSVRRPLPLPTLRSSCDWSPGPPMSVNESYEPAPESLSSSTPLITLAAIVLAAAVIDVEVPTPHSLNQRR